MNRVLLIAVVILSLGIAGVIGYTVAYQQFPQTNSVSSQQPELKYTQQQIADMQAKLEEIETALIENEKQQKDTNEKIWSYRTQQAVYTVFLFQNYYFSGINPQSAVDTSIQLVAENLAKLQELQAQHQKLFERKILLMVKLELI